jgi:hypothetical protein
MSMERQPFVERRHTARVSVSGNAIVHAATGVIRCQILDLSMGGARFRSTEELAIALDLGTLVRIDVHLDARDTAWTHLRGHIHRVVDGVSFCVAFHRISAEFEDLVEDEVLAGLEADQRPMALIVDLTTDRRARIEVALRTAGCSVIAMTTPLDAIAVIEQSRAHISLVLVSERVAHATRALTRFLREVHPAIKLAIIADRPPGTLDQTGWLFADQPDLGLQLRRLIAGRATPQWTLPPSERTSVSGRA